MPSRITTASSVDAAKPVFGRQLEIPDSKVAGLALRVAATGAKSWTFRYRNAGGKQQRITFGQYPSVALSDARERAYKALASISDGGDPAAQKKVVKARAKAGRLQTVADLIERYLLDAQKGRHRPNGRSKRPGTIAIDRYYFERLVRPKFGKLPLAELTRAEVQAFLDDVAKGSPSNARHCRNVIRQAYNYAIRRELTDKNPATFAELARLEFRDRVLTNAELKLVWNCARHPAHFSKLGMSKAMGLAICVIAVTLQRGDEVCGLHAREIDRNARLWIIPGERTKNHRTHVVPLSELALNILDQAFLLAADQTGFAFPSGRAKNGHLRRSSMDHAFKRLTARMNIADARPHDLRRTGATAMTSERIGLSRFIVSQVLNQISDSGGAAAVTSIYDRNEYLAEKRRALDAWAALLNELVSGCN